MKLSLFGANYQAAAMLMAKSCLIGAIGGCLHLYL
jgi:hypothetical protein